MDFNRIRSEIIFKRTYSRPKDEIFESWDDTVIELLNTKSGFGKEHLVDT